MATYTKNINLLKPAEQEKYDVNLRNNNWDKIDKAIGDGSDALKAHKMPTLSTIQMVLLQLLN